MQIEVHSIYSVERAIIIEGHNCSLNYCITHQDEAEPQSIYFVFDWLYNKDQAYLRSLLRRQHATKGAKTYGEAFSRMSGQIITIQKSNIRYDWSDVEELIQTFNHVPTR